MTGAPPGVLRARSGLLLGLALLVALAAVRVVAGGELSFDQSALRLAAGGVLVLLGPGLLVGEALGVRARHPLEAVALGLAITSTLELALYAAVAALGLGIRAWLCGLLTVAAAAGVAAARRRRPGLLAPLAELLVAPRPARLVLVGCVAALTWVAYRWGEDPWGLAGEKLLHAAITRRFLHAAFDPGSLALVPGSPPPNLVQFFELQAAGWAVASGLDPLCVLERARAALPLLSLSAFFLLAQRVVRSSRLADAVALAAVALAAAGVLFLPPSRLAWIPAADPLRGAFAFHGTAHHADVAMEVLLPLTLGLGLRAFQRRRAGPLALFVGALCVDFTMHAREFLQSALYVGVAGVAILGARQLPWRTGLRRWARVMGALALTGLTLAAASSVLVPLAAHAYPEGELKRRALTLALDPVNLLTVRNLFEFPLHGQLVDYFHGADIRDPLQFHAAMARERGVDPWLLLMALSVAVLALLGRGRARAVGVVVGAVWVLTITWNSGVLVVTALTYSEFYMTTPRLLAPFIYLTLPLAALTAASRIGVQPLARLGRPAILAASLLAAWPAAGVVGPTALLAACAGGAVPRGRGHPAAACARAALVAAAASGSLIAWHRLPMRPSLRAIGMVLAAGGLGLAAAFASRTIGPWLRRRTWSVWSLGALNLLALGLALAWWIARGQPGAAVAAWASTLAVWTSLAWVAWRGGEAAGPRRGPAVGDVGRGGWLLLLLLGPLVAGPSARTAARALHQARPDVTWVGERNLFGASPALLAWLRDLEPDTTIAVDPTGRVFPSLFSPCYTAPVPSPFGRLLPYFEDFAQAERGAHPLYSPSNIGEPAAIDHAAVLRQLDRFHARFALVVGPLAPAVRTYAARHPSDYRLAFDDGLGQALVLERLRR